MAVTKCPNLMLLPSTPVGKHVEGHLEYLGKVIQSWRRYPWEWEGWTETPQEEEFDPGWTEAQVEEEYDPGWVETQVEEEEEFVKADIPMYSTPRGHLMVPPLPAPEEEEEESSNPASDKRKFLRRLDTALNTLRRNLENKSNHEVADDDLLLKTLENVVSAKKSYMHHRDRCPWRPV